MQQAKKGIAFKKLPLFVAVLGCLYGGNALAQAETAESEPAKKKEARSNSTKSRLRAR